MENFGLDGVDMSSILRFTLARRNPVYGPLSQPAQKLIHHLVSGSSLQAAAGPVPFSFSRNFTAAAPEAPLSAKKIWNTISTTLWPGEFTLPLFLKQWFFALTRCLVEFWCCMGP